MKNRSLVRNTMVLFTAAAVTKIIGAVLKIPLGNLLGGIGMGYFSAAYSFFSPVLSLTAAGIPIVLTRLVAACAAENRCREAERVRKDGLFLGIVLGLIGALTILLFAYPFAVFVLGSEESFAAIAAIAPSALFCCVAAVYRGYFEGMSDMYPTAASQIIEAAVKAAAGLGLAVATLGFFTDRLGSPEAALPYAAAGAVLGVSFSELCGMTYLVLRRRKRDYRFIPVPVGKCHAGKRAIFRELLPVSAGALAINLGSLIDLLTVKNLIDFSAEKNASFFLETFVYGGAQGISLADFGTFAYGSYTGIVASVFMLIPTMTAMASRSLYPAITAAYQRRDLAELHGKLRLAIKGTLIVGLPMGFIAAALSEPILTLLYPARTAEVFISALPLAILGLGGISLSLTAVAISAFQSLGMPRAPIVIMSVGAGVKLILSLLLIPVPALNIGGAALSTVLSHTVSAAMGLIMLQRSLGMKLPIISLLRTPMLSALASGAMSLVLFRYALASLYFPLRLLISGGGSALLYLLIILVTEKGAIRRTFFGKDLK